MVLSLLALFIALGGTAIAAKHYLITSTSQIKPSILKQLRGRTGPPGLAGANGANGAQGPQGPAGPTSLGRLTSVTGPKNLVSPSSIGESVATCPSGNNAVSGGYFSVGHSAHVFSSVGFSSAWHVALNNEGEETATVQAVAYCAPQGQAIAASNRAQAARRFAEAIAAERTRLKAKG